MPTTGTFAPRRPFIFLIELTPFVCFMNPKSAELSSEYKMYCTNAVNIIQQRIPPIAKNAPRLFAVSGCATLAVSDVACR
mmetsp:Transcript_29784/g.41129  ORF Transcript_29784/g.41129 Transcript_29784/m.41129 type:complete len:80 (+) Transcript_29784:1526-1765(+)